MTQNKVEVYLGHELSDPTEQKFLRQLRGDLERHGVSALILANLEVSSQHRQLDFVIVTAPKPPGSSVEISPPAAVFEIAPA